MKSFDRVLAGEVGGQGRGERLVRVRGHGFFTIQIDCSFELPHGMSYLFHPISCNVP